MSSPGPDIRVGSTVLTDNGTGKRGNVAFIGDTHFSPGEWVGVHLETAEGKNDGSIDSQRYFTCPPNHGLFIRRTQLRLVGV